tara:strand:+ start:5663 stop:6340 length:678 start_codon:yes stop_codon:yes gene_type:complete
MGRVNYKVILDQYKKNGKGNVRLTQSSLYLTKPISATRTTYDFDVLETQSATLVENEIRLNLNDEFIITSMGFYLQATATDGMATSYGRVLLTNVPVQVNGTLGTLNNYYQGAFSIAVNNVIYLDKWDTQKHKFIPRTQYGNFATPTQAVTDSVDFSRNAMYPVEPLITLSGAKKNDLKLQLPTSITGGTFTLKDDGGLSTSYTIDRVAVVLRGLNAQNGASFQQ